MLPRALLFSSDEQTATVLQEVLSELQVEVAYCREIFAAVEELTSRTFQIILIDWGQELEASFLFNMARELKSTRNTHTLIVVETHLAPVLVVNPDGFLEKPFTAEQARDALLQSTPFKQLARHSAQVDDSLDPSALQQEITPTSVEGTSTAGRFRNSFDEREALARAVPATVRLSKGIRSDLGNSHRKPGLIRPETSTVKKTVALACLLTLLIAVLHGEKQLGYLPPGIFGYRQFTNLRFPPQKHAIDRSPTASSQSGVETFAQVSHIPSDNFEDRNYSQNYSGRIEVRPIFGQGFSNFVKSSTPLADLIQSKAETAEPAGPSGANPLIPASLYWSPPLVSLYGGMTQTTFNQGRWSTAPITIPEETSRALLTHQVLPSYPLEALRAGLKGTVVLQALVGRDGSVEDLKLVQGYFSLGNAAIAAVKQWRFRPYRLNGEIVEMQTLLTVTFPLNNDEVNRASSNGSLITYGAWK